MVGPTLEEALIRTNHRLHLELEGVSYLKSLIRHLINGITKHFMIAPPALTMGVSSFFAHQVCFVPLSMCLWSF